MTAEPSPWVPVKTVWVDGCPKGQPRPRMGRSGHVYNPTDGPPQAWKDRLMLGLKKHRPARPYDGPVRVHICAYFPRPIQLSAACYPAGPLPMPVKPDRDNVDKMILDVMTKLGFWHDDAQVCAGGVEKFYVANGDARIGVLIAIDVSPDWPYKTVRAAKVKTLQAAARP